MSHAGQKMAVVAFSPFMLECPRPRRPAIEKSDICTQSTTRSDGAHVVSRGVIIPFQTEIFSQSEHQKACHLSLSKIEAKDTHVTREDTCIHMCGLNIF